MPRPILKLRPPYNKKVCDTCGENKLLSEFPPARYGPKCFACRAEATHNLSLKEVRRFQMLPATYGIDRAYYEKQLAEQDGRCAICRLPPPPGKVLCVDHCHMTGAVRGLLCNSCNTALGQFKDSIPSLQRAVDYLKGLKPHKL